MAVSVSAASSLAMNVERDLHMSRGDGDTSYASNSRLQEKAILKTRPVLHKAVAAAHASASSAGSAMVVADLGCSSGPNTLLVVSEVLGAVAGRRKELSAMAGGGQQLLPPAQHVQFFLNDLGRVEEAKLDSFNLPFYAPSVEEVREVIRQSEVFDINHIQLFESNWDPHDDLDDGDVVVDTVRSGVNVAKSIRAVVGPLIGHHFGEHILDDLFQLYAQNVAGHLRKVKTKYPVIVLSLKASCAPKNQANDSTIQLSPMASLCS